MIYDSDVVTLIEFCDQIFISAFLVAPTHPFTRSERRKALFVSCVLAWALETWFCVLWTSCEEHPNLNIVELFLRVRAA